MSRKLLWPLLPFVPLYGAAQALDSISYARGWRRTERLAWPVVSVGNLSVGGAGKTPLVIALAKALTEQGWQVDVLSRGYGRASDAVERVDTNATDDSAARYGDEPWLIAQAAPAPVFVGRSRVQAGRLAERTLPPTLRDAQDGAPESAAEPHARRVHLLDDGMQHRKLERDAEIVLLHRSDLETTLLPAGRLREPLAALERADFLVLRDEDVGLAPRLRRWLRHDAEIWRIRRELELPTLPGLALVFSAIAHPEEFVSSVRRLGTTIAASHAWHDHHRYTENDLDALNRSASRSGAACFLTTEKDAARLTATQRAQLERTAPLLVVRLTARLLEPESALEALEQRLLAAGGAAAGL